MLYSDFQFISHNEFIEHVKNHKNYQDNDAIILSIDPGGKFIGIAYIDLELKIAMPYGKIAVQNLTNMNHDEINHINSFNQSFQGRLIKKVDSFIQKTSKKNIKIKQKNNKNSYKYTSQLMDEIYNNKKIVGIVIGCSYLLDETGAIPSDFQEYLAKNRNIYLYNNNFDYIALYNCAIKYHNAEYRHISLQYSIIHKILKILKKDYPPITLFNESYTTLLANRILESFGFDQSQIENTDDAVAATLILNGFITMYGKKLLKY